MCLGISNSIWGPVWFLLTEPMWIFLNENFVHNCLISKLYALYGNLHGSSTLSSYRNTFYPLVSLVLNFAVFRTTSLILYVTDFITLKIPNSSCEENSLKPWLKTNPHPKASCLQSFFHSSKLQQKSWKKLIFVHLQQTSQPIYNLYLFMWICIYFAKELSLPQVSLRVLHYRLYTIIACQNPKNSEFWYTFGPKVFKYSQMAERWKVQQRGKKMRGPV